MVQRHLRRRGHPIQQDHRPRSLGRRRATRLMAAPLPVLIASPLEPEHIARIKAVDWRIELLHGADLLPRPRYVSDHTGEPTTRTHEQEARFLELLGRAEVMFDFDRAHLRDLPKVAPRLRWLQAT